MSRPTSIPDEFLDLMAERFALLADATRLAILRELMGGERTVGEVVRATGRGQANVSKHLKRLAESGLLSRRKAGLQVYYTLDDPLVASLCHLVCDTIAREAEASAARKRSLADRWKADD